MSESKTVAVVQQRTAVAAHTVEHTFDQMVRMADSFAKSGFFGVRDKDQALSLLMYGQALQKHPAIVMMDYHIINNKIAKKADAILRDFQKSGGRVDWTKYDDEGVTGVFTHPLSPTPVTVDWNMERAKKAGLATKNGDMYGKFTRAMFRARCISEGVRTVAPDATEQMYTPEEIRDMEVTEIAEPVSIDTAVAQSVAPKIPEEELAEMVATVIACATVKALKSAFQAAWRATEGDIGAQNAVKAAYDARKSALEAEQQI